MKIIIILDKHECTNPNMHHERKFVAKMIQQFVADEAITQINIKREQE